MKTSVDFEYVADDVLTEWLEGFTVEKGLIRVPTDNDIEEFGGECIVGFVYTNKGMNLYERACKRLKKLGEKYFPEDEIEIKSSAVIYS